jgi:hypothetical protein
MAATKESILAHRAKLTPVDVPEWGGQLYVRVMSGAERDAFEDETFKLNGKDVEINRKNARARLLVRCIVDEGGERLFNDNGDATLLGEQPADVLDRVYAIASKANGLSKADEDDIAKNSDSAPDNSSGTT